MSAAALALHQALSSCEVSLHSIFLFIACPVRTAEARWLPQPSERAHPTPGSRFWPRWGLIDSTQSRQRGPPLDPRLRRPRYQPATRCAQRDCPSHGLVGRCAHSSGPKYGVGLDAPLPTRHSPRDDAFWFSRPQAQDPPRPGNDRPPWQHAEEPPGPWRRSDAFPTGRLARTAREHVYPSRSPYSRVGRAPPAGGLRDDPRMPQLNGHGARDDSRTPRLNADGHDDPRRGPHKLQQQQYEHRLRQQQQQQQQQRTPDSGRERSAAQPNLRQQMQVDCALCLPALAGALHSSLLGWMRIRA